jgi:hypothetical protein
LYHGEIDAYGRNIYHRLAPELKSARDPALMRSSESCQDIAKGLIIGLARERISPADRERILKIALRYAEALNARIAHRTKSNGTTPPVS